jgi:hypothetical protein
MVFGEEIHFLINEPSSAQNFSELFLKYMGIDKIGIKMKGTFLKLWFKQQSKVIGPLLYDEEHIYRVVAFDYDYGKLWLKRFRST